GVDRRHAAAGRIRSHAVGRSEKGARLRLVMALASTVDPAISAAAPRPDWSFLLAATLATALLAGLVVLDGAPASAALILLGFALGIVFLKAEFGFTAAWRKFLVRGEAGGLIGAFILIALLAC